MGMNEKRRADGVVFRRTKRGRRSWLDILKACPIPMEDLPQRSREYPKKPRLIRA
jgi:hypothetical protein